MNNENIYIIECLRKVYKPELYEYGYGIIDILYKVRDARKADYTSIFIEKNNDPSEKDLYATICGLRKETDEEFAARLAKDSA